MTEPIIYVDRSTIRPGKEDELRKGVEELVEFIESREPQLIGYDFYFDSHLGEMTVIAIHPDSESLQIHMEVGRTTFQRLADLLDLRSIQVYGEPSAEVRKLLDDKAAMLGDHARVEIHTRQAGFMRL